MSFLPNLAKIGLEDAPDFGTMLNNPWHGYQVDDEYVQLLLMSIVLPLFKRISNANSNSSTSY